MVLVGTLKAPYTPVPVTAPWLEPSAPYTPVSPTAPWLELKPGPPVAPTVPLKEKAAEPERFVPGVVRPGYAGPAPGISGVSAVPTKKIVGKIAPKVPEPRPVRLAGEPEPAPAGIAYRSVGVGRPYIPYSTRAVQIMAPGATQQELTKSYKGALARAKELAPHTPGWAGMGKAEKSEIRREILGLELARRGVARVEREPRAIPPEPLEAKPVYIRFKSAGTTVVLRPRRGQEKFVIEQLKGQGVPAKAIKPTKAEIAKALSIEQYGEWQRALGIVRPPTAEGVVTLPPTLAERRIGIPPTEGPLARLELGAPRRLPLPRGLGVIEAPTLIFAPPGLPAEPAPRWVPSPAMERLVPVYAPYYTKPRPPGLPAVPKEAVPISEVVSGVAERIKAAPIIGPIAEIAYRPVKPFIEPFIEPAAGFALGAAEAAVYAPIMAMEYIVAPPVRKVEIVRETIMDWWRRPVALGVAVSPAFGVGYVIGGFWMAGKIFGAPARVMRGVVGKPTALQIPWVKVRKVERITKIPEPGLAAYYEAAAVRIKPRVGIGKPGAILGPRVEVARVLTKGEVFVPKKPTYEPLPKYYGDIVAPIKARAEAVSLIEVAGRPDIKRIGAVSKAFDVAEIPGMKVKTTFAVGKVKQMGLSARDVRALTTTKEFPKRYVFVGVGGEPLKPPTTVSIGAVEKYVGKVGERREMVRVKGMEAIRYEPAPPEMVRRVPTRKLYEAPEIGAEEIMKEWETWLKAEEKVSPEVEVAGRGAQQVLQRQRLTPIEEARVAEAVAEAVSYEVVEAVMPKRIPAVAPAMVAGMIGIPKEAVVSRVDVPRPEPARVRMRDVGEAIKVKPAMAPIEIMAPKITPREILLPYEALAPAQATRVGLALRAITKPKMVMAPRIKIDIFDIPPEEPVTRLPFKIILPEPEKKEKKKRRMKRIGRATKYQPSLIAQELDIKGKMPKIVTGLEIRPMRL